MKCRWKNLNEGREKIANFLREYGDGLPEDAIEKATETKMVYNFATECDKHNEITALATYDDNDWYLCTVRYLATRPDQRRKGLGKKVINEVMRKAKKDGSCMVMAADITHDNIGSKKIFYKHGFKELNRFCWGKNDKPADILQLVRFPDKGNKCKHHKELD